MIEIIELSNIRLDRPAPWLKFESLVTEAKNIKSLRKDYNQKIFCMKNKIHHSMFSTIEWGESI